MGIITWFLISVVVLELNICSGRKEKCNLTSTNSKDLICNCSHIDSLLEREGEFIIHKNITLKEEDRCTLSHQSSMICQEKVKVKFDAKTIEIRNVRVENCSLISIETDATVKIDSAVITNSGISLTRTNISVTNSLFANSNLNVMLVYVKKNTVFDIDIVDTSFCKSEDAAFNVKVGKNCLSSFRITNCTFQNNNKDIHFSHTTTLSDEETNLSIYNSTFQSSSHSSLTVEFMKAKIYTEITNCSFSSHKRIAVVFRSGSSNIIVNNCEFRDNKVGLEAYQGDILKILKTKFTGHSRAIYSSINTEINGGMFWNNQMKVLYQNQALVYLDSKHPMTISDTVFSKNSDPSKDFNCSVIYANYCNNFTIKNTSISDNKCSGILLRASNLYINENVTFKKNVGTFGGGLRLHYAISPKGLNSLQLHESKIILQPHSHLHLIDNMAQVYGGGIYVDKLSSNCSAFACSDAVDNSCFFSVPCREDQVLSFSGSKANKAGDHIFGECMTQCCFNSSTIDVGDTSNIFWEIAEQVNNQSASIYAESPKKVSFCKNETETGKVFLSTCDNKMDLQDVYPGKHFTVSLMIIDGSCSASKGVIQTRMRNNMSTLNNSDLCKPSPKYCEKFSYTVFGTSRNPAVLDFFTEEEHGTSQNATLTIHFLNCPPGFVVDEKRGCVCIKNISEAGIECSAEKLKFCVKGRAWIGQIGEHIAFHKSCRRCSNANGISMEANKSDMLCSRDNRSGVMCGTCSSGLSLKLGGSSCGEYFNSNRTSFVVVIVCALFGILLVLVIFKFNLTVSTGLFSGYVFYSNIVFLNSEDYIQISHPYNSTDRALKAFQIILAWTNLDVGIEMCFFDGYSDYVAVWIQFLFPLYLWALIAVIYTVSRYSMRVSKVSGTNTVPALATIALLSYSKLVSGALSGLSFTDVLIVNESVIEKSRVWAHDPNIHYLNRKHIPLFIVSLLVGLLYIVPFTLLILLGPIFQSLSHLRLFKWVNKCKPFLDAFYGIYSDVFRYWPGTLLMVRVLLLNFFAFYSLDETKYRLALVTFFSILLIVLFWVLETSKLRPMRGNRRLKYLELFYLSNLCVYSLATLYYENEKKLKQQILTLLSLGSALLVFATTITLHVAFQIKIAHKFTQLICSKCTSNLKWITLPLTQVNSRENTPQWSGESSDKKDFMALREPLMDD